MQWNAAAIGRFFFGSPRRLLWTVAALAILFAALRPDWGAYVLTNILNLAAVMFARALGAFFTAVGPSIGPLLTLVIAVIGFLIVFNAIKPKKKKGK
jgi:energy-coupling factor transporter transmembrane protein EcfT